MFLLLCSRMEETGMKDKICVSECDSSKLHGIGSYCLPGQKILHLLSGIFELNVAVFQTAWVRLKQKTTKHILPETYEYMAELYWRLDL